MIYELRAFTVLLVRYWSVGCRWAWWLDVSSQWHHLVTFLKMKYNPRNMCSRINVWWTMVSVTGWLSWSSTYQSITSCPLHNSSWKSSLYVCVVLGYNSVIENIREKSWITVREPDRNILNWADLTNISLGFLSTGCILPYIVCFDIWIVSLNRSIKNSSDFN